MMGGPGSGRKPGSGKVLQRLVGKPHKISSEAIKKMNIQYRKKERQDRRISSVGRMWSFNKIAQLKFANKHRYDR